MRFRRKKEKPDYREIDQLEHELFPQWFDKGTDRKQFLKAAVTAIAAPAVAPQLMHRWKKDSSGGLVVGEKIPQLPMHVYAASATGMAFAPGAVWQVDSANHDLTNLLFYGGKP